MNNNELFKYFGTKIIIKWEHEIGEPKRKHKKKRIAKKWLKRYGTWTAYDKECCPYKGYLIIFEDMIFVSRPMFEKLKHGAIYPIFKAVPHHGNNYTRYLLDMKFEKKKTPVNQIKISGTEILNIDLNQGWEITNLEFDNTCPPNWIDSLIVTFEKQKRGEYKMYNEQNIGTTQTSESKSENINPPKMVGWICPVCGRGLSPYTTVCPCKGWIDGKWEVTC